MFIGAVEDTVELGVIKGEIERIEVFGFLSDNGSVARNKGGTGFFA